MDVYRIGSFEVRNRLFVGTGKYASYEPMRQALDASGCQGVTVAVRRERLVDQQGRRRLKEAGAASVMPAGSPIGSGQGVLNPLNISLCLETLKENDRNYPVIVDAGVGTASDVAVAMELGADGVLLNTGVAHAKDPVK